MPLPAGIDPSLAWCVLWAASALAILAAVSQVAPDQALVDKARTRVANRLLDLNRHLDNQTVVQWQISNSAPIIPDMDALQALHRHVDRSAAPITWLERRRSSIELARVLAGLELLLAIAFAGLVMAGVDRTTLAMLAGIAFGVGTAASVTSLVFGLICGLFVTQGADF
jgi:hypothetical protein